MKGKHEMRASKPRILLLAAALIAVLTVGGTVAWLAVSTGAVENTFQPSHVTSEVDEKFNGITKSDVRIRNTGDIDAYIRVALVPTWQDDSRNAAAVPAGLSDLTFTGLTGSSWFVKDGYYYCKNPIAPEGYTGYLFTTATVRTDSAGYLAGYHMNLQILCDAIQAEGGTGTTPAVKAAGWPVTVNANGTLRAN